MPHHFHPHHVCLGKSRVYQSEAPSGQLGSQGFNKLRALAFWVLFNLQLYRITHCTELGKLFNAHITSCCCHNTFVLTLSCLFLQNWGGGSVCQSEASSGQPQVQLDCRVFNNMTGAFDRNTTCFAPAEPSLCTGNGEVELLFGSPEYVGLGAVVFLVLILLETFGSPFMRNCEVRLLMLGTSCA